MLDDAWRGGWEGEHDNLRCNRRIAHELGNKTFFILDTKCHCLGNLK